MVSNQLELVPEVRVRFDNKQQSHQVKLKQSWKGFMYVMGIPVAGKPAFLYWKSPGIIM